MPDELYDNMAVFTGAILYVLKIANHWVIDNNKKVVSFFYVTNKLYVTFEA